MDAVNVMLPPLSSAIELPLAAKDTVGTVSSSVIVKVAAFEDEIETLGLLTDEIVIVPVHLLHKRCHQ